MRKHFGILAAAAFIAAGLILLYFGSLRTVTFVINGYPYSIQTRALTAGQAMREAGLPFNPGDRLYPSVNRLLGWNPVVVQVRASQVQVWSPQEGLSRPFRSSSQLPANLLLEAGLRLFPNDRVLWNGQSVAAAAALPLAPTYTLQFEPADAVEVQANGESSLVYTQSPSAAGALWQAGIPITAIDDLSVPPGEAPEIDEPVVLEPADPLIIRIGEQEISARTAAETVGQALAEAGVSLQELDYSQPAETEPIPPDRTIRVVRVREETVLEQEAIPFDTEFVADPDTELDQRSIVEAGQYGIQVSRVRVRYEDGQEVTRETEAEWTASEPETQLSGYGTQVQVRSMDTPAGPIEYWRSVTVYATSYSPCRLGTGTCNTRTASGAPLQRGIIAVSTPWYRDMAGQSVYIPGYGRAVIGDVGGGIPGEYWIDLGFSDEDYESWHSNVTLYFLTPVPPAIPYILP